MMAVGAFNQVQSSLRWFVDNFSAIADWRATLLRVASFRRAVMTTDVLHTVESRIDFFETNGGTFDLENLEIASPDRLHPARARRDVEIKRGERVVIVGESGTGKTLFSAPWPGFGPGAAGGSAGRRARTSSTCRARPIFRPARCARCSPIPPPCRSSSDDDFAEALDRVGLDASRCRCSTRRSAGTGELSDDEQHAVAFARVSLHKPPWLMIDEVLDSIDDTHL